MSLEQPDQGAARHVPHILDIGVTRIGSPTSAPAGVMVTPAVVIERSPADVDTARTSQLLFSFDSGTACAVSTQTLYSSPAAVLISGELTRVLAKARNKTVCVLI